MSNFILHSIPCICFDLKITKQEASSGKKDFAICSEIDEKGKFVSHIAQCASCGNIHLVTGFQQSRLQGKDDTTLIPNIEELELEVPERVGRFLKLNKCPLHIWQAAVYTFKYKNFPACIPLSQEEYVESGKPIPDIITKLLIINDENSLQIVNDKSEPFSIAKPE